MSEQMYKGRPYVTNEDGSVTAETRVGKRAFPDLDALDAFISPKPVTLTPKKVLELGAWASVFVIPVAIGAYWHYTSPTRSYEACLAHVESNDGMLVQAPLLAACKVIFKERPPATSSLYRTAICILDRVDGATSAVIAGERVAQCERENRP